MAAAQRTKASPARQAAPRPAPHSEASSRARPATKKPARKRAKATRPRVEAAAVRNALRVTAVSAETWPDFERLFLARGSPHYCWCGVYRWRDAHAIDADEKRARMRQLVAAGTPIGVLAYDGDSAVAWCSVAPRESYVKLERSRTMPRVSTAPTWTVLCFFVQRPYRKAGLPEQLLRGALDIARQHGARVMEGYPYDTAGISSTHRGTSRAFRAAGFRRQGSRWFIELAKGAGG